MAGGAGLTASAGGCNAELGIASDTDKFIAATDVTLIAAEEVWHDATPDSDIELSSVGVECIIANDADIILTLSAQVDSGVIAFYCFWTPLSSDGAVEAA